MSSMFGGGGGISQSMKKKSKSRHSDPIMWRGEPDDPRQNMEPTDMDPDDARKFITQLIRGMYNRVEEMPKDEFTIPDDFRNVGEHERAKQYYGDEQVQLISGIESALREWDESGEGTQELKEKYSGTFVRGVEIGERLAVYQGSDFTFTDTSGDDDNKFTFSG